MFGFITKMSDAAMTFFSCNTFKCVSINNKDFKK